MRIENVQLSSLSHSLCAVFQSFLLYSGCSNCILGHLYMIVKPRHQKTVRMELEDCCKVDICVNLPLSSSLFGTVRRGHYTWCVDSYIFLLFSYSIVRVKYEQCSSYVHTFTEKEPCPAKKKNDLTLRRRRMCTNFNFFTFVHVRQQIWQSDTWALEDERNK